MKSFQTPQPKGPNPGSGQEQLNALVALYSRGRLQEALSLGTTLAAQFPKSPLIPNLLGAVYARLGRKQDAVISYRKALELKPDYAEAHNNLGVALNDTGKYEEAVASFSRALKFRPDYAEAHTNLGNALKHLGKHEEAIASHKQAVLLKSDFAGAHNNLGNAYNDIGRHEEAAASYSRAIQIRPDYAEAHSNRGNALQILKRFEEALASYDRAIALRPGSAEIYGNRGTALRSLNRSEEALASFGKAIALRPAYAEAHSNRGNALQDLNRFEEALTSFDRALELEPSSAEAYSNRGNALRNLNRFEEALASFDRAIALQPGFSEAHWNQSLCLLVMGRFEQGWRQYEQRKKFGELIAAPWLGEDDIAGKALFIHSEQGFGDTIQFCRYAKLVEARGAKVVMSVQQPLQRLLQQISPTIEVLNPAETPAAYDYHCPLLSLPLALGTTLETIPAEPRYLKADGELRSAWSARLPPKTKPRIGVVWSGSATHKNDRNRSIDLKQFLQLFRPDAEWIVLQKEIGEADLALLRQDGRAVFYGMTSGTSAIRQHCWT